MCQGCTKLARTLGQREMRYGLQHLDTNKQGTQCLHLLFTESPSDSFTPTSQIWVQFRPSRRRRLCYARRLLKSM
ncbi:hypothetical protein BCR44DRAFT_1439909 [Catenaria anguillulae PL171]|nr:hypothetical protein BCR44DRAFT_1439909 [Catenaria anguillulae PL171]